jgi:hypothetical protein
MRARMAIADREKAGLLRRLRRPILEILREIREEVLTIDFATLLARPLFPSTRRYGSQFRAGPCPR